jgi:hypothetical protein
MTTRSEPREIVEACVHQFKRDKLHTGSGAPARSRKQAIAIGLAIAATAKALAERTNPRVEQALQRMSELDPALAAKVHTAERRQLALFDADAPSDEGDHAWTYLGREKPSTGNGSIYKCSRCPVTKRVEWRGERRVTKYSADGTNYRAARVACSREGKGSG